MSSDTSSAPQRRHRPMTLDRRPWESHLETAGLLWLAGTGSLPVTLIALTAFGVADLRLLAVTLLLPAVLVAGRLLAHDAHLRAAVGTAWVIGLVSTALYDLFRFGFIWLGLLSGDPIPHIGVALGLDPDWLFGYIWRYAGNGGGLAIAFHVLGFRGTRAGVLYGLFVCGGLLVTLAVSPYGQEMLFPLTFTTVAMATGGHLIYGAVLGRLSTRTAGLPRMPLALAPVGGRRSPACSPKVGRAWVAPGSPPSRSSPVGETALGTTIAAELAPNAA